MLFRHLDDQFIVYLQDQFRVRHVALQPPVHVDHGKLDNVRRRPLNGRVHGDSFSCRLYHFVAGE